MIQVRSDLSGSLIPEGSVNAGRVPIFFAFGGIVVRLECVNASTDLTVEDLRRVVLEGRSECAHIWDTSDYPMPHRIPGKLQ
jgi:hypothetical protein